MKTGFCLRLNNETGFDLTFSVGNGFGFVGCKNLNGTVSRNFLKTDSENMADETDRPLTFEQMVRESCQPKNVWLELNLSVSTLAYQRNIAPDELNLDFHTLH